MYRTLIKTWELPNMTVTLRKINGRNWPRDGPVVEAVEAFLVGPYTDGAAMTMPTGYEAHFDKRTAPAMTAADKIRESVANAEALGADTPEAIARSVAEQWGWEITNRPRLSPLSHVRAAMLKAAEHAEQPPRVLETRSNGHWTTIRIEAHPDTVHDVNDAVDKMRALHPMVMVEVVFVYRLDASSPFVTASTSNDPIGVADLSFTGGHADEDTITVSGIGSPSAIAAAVQRHVEAQAGGVSIRITNASDGTPKP